MCRILETVIHKVDENAQELHELHSQFGVKQSVMMTERELAADARDQTLKCTLSVYCVKGLASLPRWLSWLRHSAHRLGTVCRRSLGSIPRVGR